MSLFPVGNEDEGERLTSFIGKKMKLSLASVKSLIHEGALFINGKRERFGSRRLRKGERVEVKGEQKSFEKQLLPPPIFEDQWLFVVNKPPRLTSEEVEKLSGYFLAHRIDRETSGLLLLGKTKEVAQKLHASFEERAIKKRYLARAWNLRHKMLPKQGVFHSFLLPKESFQGQTLWREAPKGKEAITDYSILWASETEMALELFPKTGRTHQLRVQLEAEGLPIQGDLLYGPKDAKSRPTLALLAQSLSFVHPISGEQMHFELSVPKIFQRKV